MDDKDRKLYDAIVIGAGPAGLSAGIYLARFRRKTLIIDAEGGRSMTPGVYHNIMGFLEPIERQKLRKLGADQARRYGAEKICGCVENIEVLPDENFNVITSDSMYTTKNIILCTGVMDNWPQIPDYEKYLGISLHSCPVCAGYETINKKVVVTGTNRVAGFALELLAYTDQISIVTEGKDIEIDEWRQERINKLNIPVYKNKIVKLIGKNSWLEKVVLDDGNELEVDILYSARGVTVKSDLAQKMGVRVNSDGYIIVDERNRTNITGVYAAGDVTNFDFKQVVKAMYEGYEAARTIHEELLMEQLDKI